MAQQIKALATKAEDLRLIPQTHKWKERTNYQKVSSDPHRQAMHPSAYPHTYK